MPSTDEAITLSWIANMRTGKHAFSAHRTQRRLYRLRQMRKVRGTGATSDKSVAVVIGERGVRTPPLRLAEGKDGKS